MKFARIVSSCASISTRASENCLTGQSVISLFLWPGLKKVRFSKDAETFRARKPRAKSRALRLQSCFIHIFLIWSEFLFIQEVSGACTSPFLDADELKITLLAGKVSEAFQKRALQARVVRTVDSALHRINQYPVDRVICFVKRYPLDTVIQSWSNRDNSDFLIAYS